MTVDLGCGRYTKIYISKITTLISVDVTIQDIIFLYSMIIEWCMTINVKNILDPCFKILFTLMSLFEAKLSFTVILWFWIVVNIGPFSFGMSWIIFGVLAEDAIGAGEGLVSRSFIAFIWTLGVLTTGFVPFVFGTVTGFFFCFAFWWALFLIS